MLKVRDHKDYANLRPQNLSEFIGQTTLCNNLNIFMQAAQKREEASRPCITIWPSRFRKDYSSKNNCK